MKYYHVQKLDARYNGHPYFSHFIEPKFVVGQSLTSFHYDKTQKFIEMRQWFWETFGASRELRFVRFSETPNVEWAWDSDNGHLRIYAKEKQLEWCLLKWD